MFHLRALDFSPKLNRIPEILPLGILYISYGIYDQVPTAGCTSSGKLPHLVLPRLLLWSAVDDHI